ncbi:hypothetical protein FQN54_005332 [Arachnomyces sp. PD_36]|nr:hypothetical protein FQN54_005332 [Arachnomyces sp. PD_36]
MSFWRAISHQIHCSAPQAISGTERISIARQSRRYLSTAGSPNGRRICSWNNHASANLSWRGMRKNPNQIQTLSRSRRREFSATPFAAHGHIDPPKPGEELNVTFIDKDGDRHDFQVAKGDNLLDIAQANDLEMEGACGGSCACSTCHVIVEDEAMYDKLEEPDDDENDMLDLAFGLTETSRLGCQVKMAPELDGMVVKLPSMTRNMQASDFTDKK